MRVLRLLITGVAFSAAASYAAAAEHSHHASPPPRSAAKTQFTQAMDAGMSKMMADMHAAGSSGNPDVDFLAMMIPHHEGAVEMARLLLIHGADPVSRRLAEDIIASQQVEIEGMRRRLEQLRSGASPDEPDGFPALGGTRQKAPGRKTAE